MFGVIGWGVSSVVWKVIYILMYCILVLKKINVFEKVSKYLFDFIWLLYVVE